MLHNKYMDIETIIADHHPHVLGLGEANHRHDHDLDAVQIPGYNLHLDSAVGNMAVGGMARVAVYTHSSLRVKRRYDLEDDKIAAKILDDMAPIKTFQTRSNYAPWLQEETKLLKDQREAAQSKAAQTDDPEDWRIYRSLRNQVTGKSRADKTQWEQQKLDNSNDMWKTVKGWLGWTTNTVIS